MVKIGVIGGSGFYDWPELMQQHTRAVETPYGAVEALTEGSLAGRDVVFIARHGKNHETPPHKVNYRANIHAMASLGVTHVISVNATGGISPTCAPGHVVIPDQVIDYSYGREHTFSDGKSGPLHHIDFTYPFDAGLRQRLKESCDSQRLHLAYGATYGCTQGPRLESAAEIKKMHNDGCDLVGMTLMPEAALARERDLAYASLCLVVNWCAGVCDEVISMDKILARLDSFVPKIREAILKTIHSL